MTIEGKDYFIPWENYVKKYSAFGLYERCYLKIMANPSIDFYIMGLNFFENYYTVFDKD